VEGTAQAQRRGGIDVVVTALERAAVLSPTSASRRHRLVHAAELAYDIGRARRRITLLGQIEPGTDDMLALARATWLREMLAPGDLAEGKRAMLLHTAATVHAAGDPNLASKLLWLVASKCWWRSVRDDGRTLIWATGTARDRPPMRRGC
jgi:hypothetical protein